MSPASMVLLLVIVVLVLRRRNAPAAPPVDGYLIPTGAGNPTVGPGALSDPRTGATGQPSTRAQIESGVGTIVGAGAGLYVCGGNPACIGAGAFVGRLAAPAISHGAEAAGKTIAKVGESAWNNTLGRIF